MPNDGKMFIVACADGTSNDGLVSINGIPVLRTSSVQGQTYTLKKGDKITSNRYGTWLGLKPFYE